MKQVLKSITYLLMLCLLVGCGGDFASENELKDGITLMDVVSEIENQISLQMAGEVDDSLLKETYYLDLSNVETYSGKASESQTSCDTVLGVKAISGKVDEVVNALQKRQQDLINRYQNYLPNELHKAEAGKIIVKGDYAFLIVLGESEDSIEEDLQKAETIINSYFT